MGHEPRSPGWESCVCLIHPSIPPPPCADCLPWYIVSTGRCVHLKSFVCCFQLLIANTCICYEYELQMRTDWKLTVAPPYDLFRTRNSKFRTWLATRQSWPYTNNYGTKCLWRHSQVSKEAHSTVTVTVAILVASHSANPKMGKEAEPSEAAT